MVQKITAKELYLCFGSVTCKYEGRKFCAFVGWNPLGENGVGRWEDHSLQGESCHGLRMLVVVAVVVVVVVYSYLLAAAPAKIRRNIII